MPLDECCAAATMLGGQIIRADWVNGERAASSSCRIGLLCCSPVRSRPGVCALLLLLSPGLSQPVGSCFVRLVQAKDQKIQTKTRWLLGDYAR